MADEYEIIVYQTERGKEPYSQWIKSLKNRKAQSIILRRIQRIRGGLFGDTKVIAGSKSLRELRVDFGPGYRVYYAKVGGRLILLIGGGDKRTQKKDIEIAKSYLLDYKENI